MHAVGDYTPTKEVWSQLVPTEKQDWFFSRDLEKWLATNLQNSQNEFSYFSESVMECRRIIKRSYNWAKQYASQPKTNSIVRQWENVKPGWADKWSQLRTYKLWFHSSYCQQQTIQQAHSLVKCKLKSNHGFKVLQETKGMPKESFANENYTINLKVTNHYNITQSTQTST